jgi:hypothetical protein
VGDDLQEKEGKPMKLHSSWLALAVLAAFAVLGGLVATDVAEADPPRAVCGDNKLNHPSEECDGRDDISCPDLCSSDCTCTPDPSALEPRVEVLEEDSITTQQALCEYLFARKIDVGPASEFCLKFRELKVLPSKTIFLTSDAYTADLGGLAGADAKCQEHAERTLQLTGNYRAWLSSELTDARDRLTHNPGPYRLPSGTLVALNWTDLVDGWLLHPINETESAIAVGPGTPALGVWTATQSNGTVSAFPAGTCGDWTSLVGEGKAGLNYYLDPFWTRATTFICDSDRPLYCVEQ